MNNEHANDPTKNVTSKDPLMPVTRDLKMSTLVKGHHREKRC